MLDKPTLWEVYMYLSQSEKTVKYHKKIRHSKEHLLPVFLRGNLHMELSRTNTQPHTARQLLRCSGHV